MIFTRRTAVLMGLGALVAPAASSAANEQVRRARIAGRKTMMYDPTNGKLGSPEITSEMQDGTIVMFSNESEKETFEKHPDKFVLGYSMQLGFGGFDPVEYTHHEKFTPGLLKFKDMEGAVYFLFASEENIRAFQNRGAELFLIAFGGYCLRGLAEQNAAMQVADPHYIVQFAGDRYGFHRAADAQWFAGLSDAEKKQAIEKASDFYFQQTGAPKHRNIARG